MKCRFGCNRLYTTLSAMDAHRQASHPNAAAGHIKLKKRAVTACNDCGGTFSSVDALRQHQLDMPDHIRLAREGGSFMCEKCNRSLRSQDALEQHFVADHSLIQLAEGDSLRVKLETEFIASWRKPSPPRKILTVFKIYNPGWRNLEFQQYKDKLTTSSNEVSRYHGTTLLCDLGNRAEKHSKLCQNEGCNLCCILRTGFKTAKAKNTWQRFGKGIYTTATSGKSNDYITSNSSQKAVLVCRVLAGKVYRTETNMPTLLAPPEGFDSVSGEVGRILNYDETVVYTSNAILPFYMIVYTT